MNNPSLSSEMDQIRTSQSYLEHTERLYKQNEYYEKTKERRRECANKCYQNNKEAFNRKRVIKRLQNGGVVYKRTLIKYCIVPEPEWNCRILF